ncbi:MAG TPA: fused MFS/spermidine synthase, partial [Patescibacteria group bacterium]|nr:fused MFS/spermidine synthase [Patescibacteria group bacterium]
MSYDAPEASNARTGRLPLLVIFFLSGASGLIYEVVWSRSLVLVFGSTTHAISTVLAAFMGGLALGSYLVGRRGDRFGDPLKVYALLEVAIAVLALAVLVALPAMVPVYRLAWHVAGASPAALNVLRFFLASLILLPPTTLMGATLPILSAYLERASATSTTSGAGSSAGALYTFNTFGAVAGAATSGFLLLPALGVTRAALLAAAANLIAAASAMRLSRSLPAARAAQAAQAVPSTLAITQDAPAQSEPAEGAVSPALLLLVFAASGAGALMFEVVWTRILSLILGSSTQAFSIMLTTFLTGLALGSAVATRWLKKISRPLLVFTLIELGAGLSAFAGIYLFPELPYVFL